MARKYVASKKRRNTIMYYDESDMLMVFRTKGCPHVDIKRNSRNRFDDLIKNDEYYITKEKANEICKEWYKNVKNKSK